MIPRGYGGAPLSKYWKFLVALLTAFVEAGALWADAPPWFVTAVGFAGAALVWAVKNQPAEPDDR